MLAPLLLSVTLGQAADAPPWVPKFDRQGDPLPAGAVARFGTTRYRHGAELVDLQLSPSGQFVATRAKDDAELRLWETASGREIGTFPQKGLPIQRVTFLTDATLAVVADGVWLWTSGRAAVRVSAELLPEKFFAVALSPDGKMLAVGGEKAVHLLPFDAPKGVSKVLAANAPPIGLTFSPDGKWLAAENASTVSLWDVGAGKRTRSFVTSSAPLVRFGAASDGLYTLSSAGVRALALDSDEDAGGFEPFGGDLQICDLRLSRDGKSLSVLESSGTVHLLDAKTGKALGKPRPAPKDIAPCAFAALGPDGKSVVSRWNDQRWATWNPATGVHSAAALNSPLVALRLTPDGKSAICQDDTDCLRAWSVADGTPLRERRPRGKDAPAGAVCDDQGERILYETDGLETVCLRVKDGELLKKSVPHAAASHTLQFLSGHPSRHVRFLADSTQLCDLDGKRPTRTIPYAAVPCGGCAALSPDGRTLVLGGKKEETLLIETATGKVRLAVKVQASEIQFSPDGRTLGVAETGGFVTLLDSVAGRQLRQLSLLGSGHTHLAFSPDGKRVAAVCHGSERTIPVWDIATGESVTEFPGHPTGNTAGLAFTPDGTRLVTCGSEGCGYVWDLRYRKPAEPLGRGNHYTSIAEARAALASTDGEEAYHAVAYLAQHPVAALAELRTAVRPATGPTGEELRGLVAKLSSKEFKDRDAGRKRLADAGVAAVDALRAEAKAPGSPESGRTAADLLARTEAGYSTATDLLAARAVEAVERIGTADAKRLLTAWAAGEPAATLSVEAKAALARWK